MCIFDEGGRSVAARFYGRSAFVPYELRDEPWQVNEAIVVGDDLAAESFPSMEIVYVFQRWRPDAIELRSQVRVADTVVPLRTLNLPRAEDGTAFMNLDGQIIRFTERGRSAVVSLHSETGPSAESVTLSEHD
jgi:hypothetical protein